MTIEVKLSSTLQYLVPEYDPSTGIIADHMEGENLTELLGRLKIDMSNISILTINDRSVRADEMIHDGDKVSLFPAVWGG